MMGKAAVACADRPDVVAGEPGLFPHDQPLVVDLLHVEQAQAQRLVPLQAQVDLQGVVQLGVVLGVVGLEAAQLSAQTNEVVKIRL